MPFLAGIAGLIPALIGAGVTGVTTGLEASGAIGGGGGSSTAPPNPAQLASQVAQQKAQLASTLNQNKGNVQEQTGGGLAPDAVAQLVGGETGNLNNINSLQDLVSSQSGQAIQQPSQPGAGGLADSGIYGAS
jgi:hypothetical protein